jgi:hypothetical protein
MYFEDIATRDLPQLPLDHKFHYLEDELKRNILPKKDVHDKEHEDQLKHWGCDPSHSSKLTIRFDEDGVAFADRMYHIALHLKYWKEKGKHTELVERFEKESGHNLDDLTAPNPSTKGESVY